MLLLFFLSHLLNFLHDRRPYFLCDNIVILFGTLHFRKHGVKLGIELFFFFNFDLVFLGNSLGERRRDGVFDTVDNPSLDFALSMMISAGFEMLLGFGVVELVTHGSVEVSYLFFIWLIAIDLIFFGFAILLKVPAKLCIDNLQCTRFFHQSKPSITNIKMIL